MRRSTDKHPFLTIPGHSWLVPVARFALPETAIRDEEQSNKNRAAFGMTGRPGYFPLAHISHLVTHLPWYWDRRTRELSNPYVIPGATVRERPHHGTAVTVVTVVTAILLAAWS
ncbi:hypothetical protein F4859DRAFT_514564 [Xylaria cf. heliscus]|nr:hypothetical protein F4859DRAFT_514564 [Xylaria cf. heliscus]